MRLHRSLPNGQRNAALANSFNAARTDHDRKVYFAEMEKARKEVEKNPELWGLRSQWSDAWYAAGNKAGFPNFRDWCASRA